MNYLKTVLKSLFKRKLSSTLIILQITIAVYFLINVLIGIDAANFQQYQIDKYTKFDRKKTATIQYENLNDSKASTNNLDKIDKYINTIPEIESYGGIYLQWLLIKNLADNESFNNKRLEAYKNYDTNAYPHSKGIIETLFVDYGTSKVMDIKIKSGRGFTRDDFTAGNKKYPILISEQYENIIPIGSILNQDTENTAKLEVIGVYKNGSYWFDNSSTYLTVAMKKQDYKFIVPKEVYIEGMTEVIGDKKSINELKSPNQIFYTLKSANDAKNVKDKIETYASNINLKVNALTFEEQFANYKEERKQIILFEFLLSFLLIGMSLFGVISVILASILERTNEFGIRISVGYTTANIKRLILGEISVLMFLSCFVALGTQKYSALQNQNSIFNTLESVVGLSTSTIIWTIIINILIVAVACILPFRKINRLQPKELIGGRE